MIIEPIFTDENWQDFLNDLQKIVPTFSEVIIEELEYLKGSITNAYGNKIEIILPIEENSITASSLLVYISILENIINNEPFKNHIFSFSIKFLDLILERHKNDEIYKEHYWTTINAMNRCFIKVYTIIEGHYFQCTFLQIMSVRMDHEKKYPLNFTARILSEDIARSYKHLRK